MDIRRRCYTLIALHPKKKVPNVTSVSPFVPNALLNPRRCCSQLVDFFGAFKRPDGSIRVVLEYMDRGSLADVMEYRTAVQVSDSDCAGKIMKLT